MEINLQDNKDRFIALVKQYIQRDGIEKVLQWLENTDFYMAPASTRYHLSVEGGLCQHSLNVFDRMVSLCNYYYGKDGTEDNVIYGGDTIDAPEAFDMESVAICALFHDICKVNCYVRDFRNVKVNGKWEQQLYWKWDEQFTYGHGEKSVYILQQFIRLYISEAQAIRYHMAGQNDPLASIIDRGYAPVFEKSKLAVLLHLADMVCAWMDEPVS